MYRDLSLSDRARIIEMAVRSGITDLSTIEEVYNTFAEGGDLEEPAERRKVGDHYLTLEQYKELQRDTIRQAAVQKALTRNKGVAPIIDGQPASSCIYTFTDNYGRKYQVAGTQTFAANPEKYGFEVAGPVKEGMEGNMYLQLNEFGVPYHATMITGYTDKGEPLLTYSSGHAGVDLTGVPISREDWERNQRAAESLQRIAGLTPERESYEHYIERFNRSHSPEADYHKNTKAWHSPQYETYRFIGTPDDNARWQTEWEAGSQPSFVPIMPEVLNNQVQFAKGGRLFETGGPEGDSGFNAGAMLLNRLKRKYLSDYADKGYVYSYPSNPFELFGYAISPYARTSEYGNYMLDVMPKNITDARRALFAKNFGVNSDGKDYENAIVESKYRPTVSSNPDAKYYTLPIDDPKARFEDLQSVIGTAKYDFGEDENGKYISVYDKWDLAPITDKGSDFLNATPPEIYDRFYQSDVPEIYNAYLDPNFDSVIGGTSGMDFSSGGKIHIKPENRGKFTALKKRTGHSASWFKAHGTPAQKKMATFALNARKWKHSDGGLMTKF